MALIGLIDVDGHHWPNLALAKISAWHKAQGDTVEWWDGLKHYDLVYQSKVFDATYTPDMDTIIQADEVIRGGTGYGLTDKLPDAIEHIYPDYDLYPQHTRGVAYGYLTRGCPRACPFCIVSGKEGRVSHKVADLTEFWRGQRTIKLLDPNLLACPDHMDLLRQLADSGAKVDFTQGLDVRLITPEIVAALNRIDIKVVHFAWDNPREDLRPQFERYMRLAKHNKHRKPGVYVLTNYQSTHAEDLWRIYALRDMGYDPYVMVYDKPHAPPLVRNVQRWCNNKIIFGAVPDFTQYCATAAKREVVAWR